MQLADLNPIALLAAAVFSICFSGLIVILIFAPRRNCFFLRWYGRSTLWGLVLPLVALFYMCATVASAARFRLGRGGTRKDRVYGEDGGR